MRNNIKPVRKYRRDVIHRWEGNPMISVEDLGFRCTGMYNAGCVKIKGKYVLLITIEHLDGCSAIYYAQSDNGMHFEVANKPLISPAGKGALHEYEAMGILDPRITYNDKTYYIIYLGKSRNGFVLCLAKTKDFKSVEKLGIISEPDTKAGALFPTKLNGMYARLERPNSGGSIWISYSRDLLAWGQSEAVLSPRGGFWDSDHIGASAPPIEIEQGWLMFYYGVKRTSAGTLTRIGAAILDKNNPTKVLERSNIPVLSPRELYERVGDINNYIFSCGAILEDKNRIKLYYGGSDNCLCLGTTTLEEIIKTCTESHWDF
jgi:predicted GH43/DUF377 family glycosyl hydrolase